MASRFVGLDIGTHAVRAAEVRIGRDGVPTLVRFGQVALPPGVVEAGEVADPGIVGDAIKRLWKQAKFSTKKVALGVANQPFPKDGKTFRGNWQYRATLPLTGEKKGEWTWNWAYKGDATQGGKRYRINFKFDSVRRKPSGKISQAIPG